MPVTLTVMAPRLVMSMLPFVEPLIPVTACAIDVLFMIVTLPFNVVAAKIPVPFARIEAPSLCFVSILTPPDPPFADRPTLLADMEP